MHWSQLQPTSKDLKDPSPVLRRLEGVVGGAIFTMATATAAAAAAADCSGRGAIC